MVTKILSLYLFAGELLLSFLFVYAFLRGKSSYSKALGALSLTLQVYILGYLMEINATSLDAMLSWNQVQYLGIPFFPALWLMVSMLYTGRGKKLWGYQGVLIFIVPTITFILRLTNEWHHLYYSRIELQVFNDTKLMLLTKGPWYIIQMLYVLVTLILCTWFYFQRFHKSEGDERIQFRLLFFASVLPYVALVLVALNIGGIGIDYTALILPPCVSLVNLALTQYNFLDIKGLARERVFTDSINGLILLNRFYRVADYNEAAGLYFSWLGVELREEAIDYLMDGEEELLAYIKDGESHILHILIDGEDRYLRTETKSVINKDEIIGHLITIEDVTERELLRKRLLEKANTDELSGLDNRRYFSEKATDAFARAKRYGEPMAVLMMDIDYFKRINDSYGHGVGDVVIREFANRLLEIFRGTDIVGRMGGEEFAVVMLHSEAVEAYDKAEAFRKLIENKKVISGKYELPVTVSIGISILSQDTPSLDALINRADNMLYSAKNSGRNCTKCE